MTKEEIKALVAAKIAGQGSAIDSASVLPTILNAIVDAIPEGGGGGVEPLIIEGVDNESYFIPNDGQPTFQQAKECFLAGGNVILVAEIDGDHRYYSVESYYTSENTLSAGLGSLAFTE